MRAPNLGTAKEVRAEHGWSLPVAESCTPTESIPSKMAISLSFLVAPQHPLNPRALMCRLQFPVPGIPEPLEIATAQQKRVV